MEAHAKGEYRKFGGGGVDYNCFAHYVSRECLLFWYGESLRRWLAGWGRGTGGRRRSSSLKPFVEKSASHNALQ